MLFTFVTDVLDVNGDILLLGLCQAGLWIWSRARVFSGRGRVVLGGVEPESESGPSRGGEWGRSWNWVVLNGRWVKKIASVESDTSKQSALHCVGLGFKLFVSGKGFQKWGFWFLMHTHSLFLVPNRCSSCNTSFFFYWAMVSATKWTWALLWCFFVFDFSHSFYSLIIPCLVFKSFYLCEIFSNL